jgi:hypothetical protein
MDMPRALKLVLLAIAALAVMVLLAGIYFMLGLTQDPFNDSVFTQTEWARTTDTDRAPMAGDLVRNHLPPGMTRTQVESLLGTPSRAESGADATKNDASGGTTYRYYIGSWSNYGYDDAWVYVHFDESGKLTKSEIYGY